MGEIVKREASSVKPKTSVVRHPSSVVVSIDELVLEGFSPHAKREIADAVQFELARLLNERGAPERWQGGGEFQDLKADAEWKPNARRQQIGAAIAQAVYTSFDGNINATNERAGTRSGI